jgi:hypothetical protein
MNPKLFISYSWSSEKHEAWVISLATQLRESAVDVILDKWDLKEGNDAHAFMERMVTDPDIKKVALICDRIYAERADGRHGGVGTETQIITPEIYGGVDQNKFVAVIAERDSDGKPYRPTYYKSRIYIDLSDADSYATNFEHLLRWIYDKPLHVKPPLGRAPGFLEDRPGPSLNTSVLFQRSIDALRNNKEHVDGAVMEYFDRFTENLGSFRIAPDGSRAGYDDEIIQSIEQFLPFRNEALELVLALARYRPGVALGTTLHRFIERLLPYQYRPEDHTGWQEFHGWNYAFIIHELFLYAIAALLKYERFDAVAYLFDNRYYVPNRDRNDPMVTYYEIRQYIEAFEHRKNRLKSRQLSLHADTLMNRCQGVGITQSQLMQADFVVFLRAALEPGADPYHQWWPETLLYAFRQHGPFEIFARAERTKDFQRLQPALGLGGLTPEEAKARVAAYFQLIRERKAELPRWEHKGFDPAMLTNFSKLATR